MFLVFFSVHGKHWSIQHLEKSDWKIGKTIRFSLKNENGKFADFRMLCSFVPYHSIYISIWKVEKVQLLSAWRGTRNRIKIIIVPKIPQFIIQPLPALPFDNFWCRLKPISMSFSWWHYIFFAHVEFPWKNAVFLFMFVHGFWCVFIARSGILLALFCTSSAKKGVLYFLQLLRVIYSYLMW